MLLAAKIMALSLLSLLLGTALVTKALAEAPYLADVSKSCSNYGNDGPSPPYGGCVLEQDLVSFSSCYDTIESVWKHFPTAPYYNPTVFNSEQGEPNAALFCGFDRDLDAFSFYYEAEESIWKYVPISPCNEPTVFEDAQCEPTTTDGERNEPTAAYDRPPKFIAPEPSTVYTNSPKTDSCTCRNSPTERLIPVLETIRDHVKPWFQVEWFRAVAILSLLVLLNIEERLEALGSKISAKFKGSKYLNWVSEGISRFGRFMAYFRPLRIAELQDEISRLHQQVEINTRIAKNARESAKKAHAAANGTKKMIKKAHAAANGTKKMIKKAHAAARNAKTVASNAKTAARKAKTAASNAKTAANNAKTVADNAQAAANNAQTTASDAQTLASNAQTAANNAQTAANNSQTAANNAQTTANNAQTTANAATNMAAAAENQANI